jgi:hypothetical protein
MGEILKHLAFVGVNAKFPPAIGATSNKNGGIGTRVDRRKVQG